MTAVSGMHNRREDRRLSILVLSAADFGDLLFLGS
jgi:hypothetical protein